MGCQLSEVPLTLICQCSGLDCFDTACLGTTGSLIFYTSFFTCSCSKPLQNYMVFNDTEGVYTYTFEAEKKVR